MLLSQGLTVEVLKRSVPRSRSNDLKDVIKPNIQIDDRIRGLSGAGNVVTLFKEFPTPA